MADLSGPSCTDTPEATAAVAQSRGAASLDNPPDAVGTPEAADDSLGYELGPGVRRAALIHRQKREHREPIYRPLKIYTIDPAVRRFEGATTTINVPYEKLHPGPCGGRFEIIAHSHTDPVPFETYHPVDLDAPEVLIRGGLDPSPSDPRFHHQMVYAVCSSVYAAFQMALGRDLAWGFADADTRHTLRIRPHAFEGRNARYMADRGELQFGYFRASDEVEGLHLPNGLVFTCLSHDIIAHELTHALLDGLRAEFRHASRADVPAFHEAFADLVAIFQHFSYPNVVKGAVKRTSGKLEEDGLLTSIANQMGFAMGDAQPLRMAVDMEPKRYDPDADPHTLGSVLLSAVFDGFLTVYRRKAEPYIRLATNGTGVLAPGAELPVDLQDILAHLASRLATQFLNICIRAIDYCPPVDIELGEYLRAMITADYDLVPNDPWAYREALTEAFGRRRLFPSGVDNLSEEALLWRPPSRPLPLIEELSFRELKFAGDPGRPCDLGELERQAHALGRFISNPAHITEFGCTHPGDPDLHGDEVDRPRVQSIRSSRRIGPQGQMVFDLIAEVTQRRRVKGGNGFPPFDFYGGSTVIIGPNGEVRYVIRKSITAQARLEAQRRYMVKSTCEQYAVVMPCYAYSTEEPMQADA